VTARFELTAPAERDLEEIFFEVMERHGRLVAERVYANLLRTFDLLASRPEIGRHRPELCA
jgi:plasmid stabilization system protein ParE